MADDTPSSLVFRTQFSSADLDEVEEFLCTNYAAITLRHTSNPERFTCGHDLVGAGGLTVSRMRTSWEYGARLDGMKGRFAVASVRTGGFRSASDHHGELCAGPGDTALTPPDGDVSWVSDPSEVDLVALDGIEVAEYAAHACGSPDEDLRVTGLSPVSDALARHWNATVAHVRDGVLSNPEVARSPILIDNAFQMLAAALLSTFPNTALAAAIDPEARHVRSGITAARLQEVVDYLDTHAHRPVGPAEIADLAGAPVREVVEGLRRHYDTSPARVLRAARLRGVHRELTDADPLTGPTVAAIATRWGFTYPGPFRAAYVTTFDEQPEATLRR